MIMNGQDDLQVIRNYFLKGTINEIWQQIEPDKWFNSAFQNFNKREIINDFPRS